MIGDEAVEAAAIAHHGNPHDRKPWDELAPMVRKLRIEKMRAALEAAAPHMLADAWDEGNIAGMFDLPSEKHATPNPYRSQA